MTVLDHTHITQGLASPANWYSGDLVDLGDLLVVLTPDDFKQVSVPGTRIYCFLWGLNVFV